MTRHTFVGLLCCSMGCSSATVPAPQPPKPQPSPTSSPTAASPDVIDDVVSGPNSTCARTKTGRVVCWGANLEHAGLPSTDPWRPTLIPTPTATRLTVGENTWCATTRPNGEVWCWGNNGAGQLGRNTAEHRDMRPGPVAHLRGVVDVVQRDKKLCARTERDEVWCWGDERVPTRMPASASVGPLVFDPHGTLCTQRPLRCGSEPPSTAAVYERHWSLYASWRSPPLTCTLDAHGTVSCTSSSSLTFPKTQLGTLSVGESHMCGLDVDGQPWCRGDDANAQVGAAATIGRARTVTTRRNHTCALTEARHVLCWGDNTVGQLARPFPAPSEDAPVKARFEGLAQSLVRFDEDICVVAEGGIHCPSKQCEDPRFERTPYTEAIVGPHGKTCLFTPGGPALCTHNHQEERQTGVDRTNIERSVATPDFGHWCVENRKFEPCDDREQLHTDGTLSAVSTDLDHACGIRPNGDLHCSGRRSESQRTHRGPYDVVSVHDGLARKKGGEYLSVDGKGDLYPMPVAGLTKVSSEGLNRSCGLDAEGTVWCWGLHGRGKVQRITAPLPFSDVEVTASHTCAIGEDASVWCWGNNVRGQLGSGEPRCARTPIDLTAEILQALEATEDSP